MDRPGKNGQERRCALTRTVLPTERLIRFVSDPAGVVVPDLKRKLPGRGVWIEARRESVARAAAKNVFARALKTSVSAPADLADQVEHLMRARALSRLSLANKAGGIVTGTEKVLEALAKNRVAVLIHASDAAADGTRKIDRQAGTVPHPPVGLFSIEELSLALGRENVVHAAGMKIPATEAFCAEVGRVVRFCDSDCSLTRGSVLPGQPADIAAEARPDLT